MLKVSSTNGDLDAIVTVLTEAFPALTSRRDPDYIRRLAQSVARGAQGTFPAPNLLEYWSELQQAEEDAALWRDHGDCGVRCEFPWLTIYVTGALCAIVGVCPDEEDTAEQKFEEALFGLLGQVGVPQHTVAALRADMHPDGGYLRWPMPDTVVDAVDGFVSGEVNGAVLLGKSGTGKTVQAGLAAQWISDSILRPHFQNSEVWLSAACPPAGAQEVRDQVLWLNFAEIPSAWMRYWKAARSEDWDGVLDMDKVWETAKKVRWLFIDDLGIAMSKDRDWMTDKLEELFAVRYNASRPTFITTNLGVAALRSFLGERIYGRLVERGLLVDCKVLSEGNEVSLRMEEAKAFKAEWRRRSAG